MAFGCWNVNLDCGTVAGMSGPELYHQYERQQTIAFFGQEDEGKVLCAGQWVILPNAVLCLTTVGQPPGASHFYPASRFNWVADRPYQVAQDEWPFLPEEVRGGRKVNRPLYLFVRATDTDPFMYVGQLAPAHTWGVISGQDFGFGGFDLLPTLPSRVWKKLGGPRPENSDTFALDEALHGLARKQSVHEHLATLRRLAEYWHGPCQPGDGLTEEELRGKPIPYPLRWWYQLAGRRKAIMSGQNILVELEELQVDKAGWLQFYNENQYCYQWATTLDGDDPPVFGRDNDGDPWTPEGMVLSVFLIEVCMFEATIKAPYGGCTVCLDNAVLSKIMARIPRMPVAPWRWPGKTYFYAGNGAFMFSAPNGEYKGKPASSVWIGAKSEQPLAFLKPIVNENPSWDFLSL